MVTLKNYFSSGQKPKILMINFTEKDISRLSGIKSSIERGFMGPEVKAEDKIRFYFPSPSYEYDIVIYNSKRIPYEKTPFPNTIDPTTEAGKIELKGLTRSKLTVCLIGHEVFNSLEWVGLHGIYIVPAHDKDSTLTFKRERDYTIGPLEDIIRAHKGNIVKVTQYFESTYRHPITHHPLIWNLNGNQIAGYGTVYNDRTTLIYVVLPQFRDNMQVLIDLLPALIDLRPELFPDIKRLNWLDDDEFIADEVKRIEQEISNEMTKITAYIKSKEDEKGRIEESNKFIRQILVADDEHFEGDDRLKPCVLKILKSLGFVVIDQDAELGAGKKGEDLLVSDPLDDYTALVEIKGTDKQNVPESFYSQTLKHLHKANKPNLRGLLVINHDRSIHPHKRQLIYKDSPELFQEPSYIGVLPTVELYKIFVATRRGIVSAEKARSIIKSDNLIIFNERNPN